MLEKNAASSFCYFTYYITCSLTLADLGFWSGGEEIFW